MSIPRQVFVTGATGYIGSRLAARLAGRGHRVAALARAGSAKKLPATVHPVPGDALDARSYAHAVAPADTFVHLVGVAHPSPARAAELETVDWPSIQAAVEAARTAQSVEHFIYMSVAQPAPAMRAYQAVRARGEALLRASGMAVTFIRPWYVLGPGRRWPLVLLPAYWMAELVPRLRAGALRTGLVTIEQMLATLVRSVEEPSVGVRVIEVPEIRRP